MVEQVTVVADDHLGIGLTCQGNKVVGVGVSQEGFQIDRVVDDRTRFL